MTIDPTTSSADELLAALTVGDLDGQDSRVQVRLAADPELAERWGSLAATIEQLRGSAAGLVPELLPTDEVPSVDTMAAIRAFRREQRIGRRRWFVLGGAAVAAAGLWLWFLALPDADRPPVPDPRLGGEHWSLAPDGIAWTEGAPLRWQPVRGADSYCLEVRPVAAGPTIEVPGAEVGDLELTRSEWLPSPPARLRLPLHFRWRVIAVDSSNTPIATSGWAETWR